MNLKKKKKIETHPQCVLLLVLANVQECNLVMWGK